MRDQEYIYCFGVKKRQKTADKKWAPRPRTRLVTPPRKLAGEREGKPQPRFVSGAANERSASYAALNPRESPDRGALDQRGAAGRQP